MGKTALFDAFLQSDLDCAGHHLLNCPDLVAGAAPNNFPPVPYSFIDQYTAASGNFGARRPDTKDLDNWPDPTGAGGLFLMANASPAGTYSWAAAGGGGGGFVPGASAINVKTWNANPLLNAVGDGVHDDTAAIQAALNAAAGTGPAGPMPQPPQAQNGGLTVYFPKGAYRISATLVPPSTVTMMGDSPWASIIVMDLMAAGAAILSLSRAGGSLVMRLGFDGRITEATGNGVPVRHGIIGFGVVSVTIDTCIVYWCLGAGIFFEFCYYATIRNTLIFGCGNLGIGLYFCPRSIVTSNVVGNCNENGIALVNSQNCTVGGNQVYSCAPFGCGILVGDSDNTAITGNVASQCAVGLGVSTSATRSLGTNWDNLFSYGYAIVGNTISRNYLGGVQIAYSHGFKLTGNVIVDNGQGGSDGAHGFTIEAGLMVLPANSGTGYAVGDLVTLSIGGTYGTGTPAKAVVMRVNAAGKIYPEGLLMISAGNYSAWPTTAVPLTGGTGTGASCVYSGSKIASGGSGYYVGQALRHNVAISANTWNVVRVMVTGVDTNGAVTNYVVTDGGGYHDTTYSTLTFVGDAYVPQTGLINGVPGVGDPSSMTGAGVGAGLDQPDLPDQGTGFTLSAGWGLRYSTLFNSGAGSTFNLETYHQINGGVVNGNVISHCKSGCGYLNLGTITPPWPNGTGSDRAGYLTFTGNNLMANLTPFSGGTVATGGHITLDGNYNVPILTTPYGPSSIFTTGAALNAPLNVIA